MKNQFKPLIRLIMLLVLSYFIHPSYGVSQSESSNSSIPDTIILDPISVDSLFISPSMPREGDVVTLWVATTHGSVPCGLLDYKVIMNSTNTIYVTARYWGSMTKPICKLLEKMTIGSLNAGKYVLNFMNKQKIEFTVFPQNKCIADFSYTYPKCADSAKCLNTVAFKDLSTGYITSWRWDFGDSTFSTLQNPIHTYSKPGIYKVCLTITCGWGVVCYSTECKAVPVSIADCKAMYKYHQLPDITMSAADLPIIAPFPSFLIQFYDISVGDVIEWYWDFGDGSISKVQNPVHLFKAGNYVVTLKIVTRFGCESKYSETLVFKNPPICQYTGTVKDYSGLDGCKYVIELDNGIKLEPVIVADSFKLHDNQRVILDYRPLKIASICMVGITAEITCIREIISPECHAYYSYVKDSLAKCLSCAVFRFYDKSIGNVNKWHWDFGDGSTSVEQNPTHTYFALSDSAIYNVCLTIGTTDGCTSTYCEKVFVGSPTPRVPWVPVIGGDDNHSILVSQNLQTNIKLEYGDYIGLFFRNYFGNLVCGGMIRWEGKNDLLIAWANTCRFDSIIIKDSILYPIPICKNGFGNNEKFEYKIWKWRTNEELLIQSAKYRVNNMFPDSGYFNVDGLSMLVSAVTSNKQEVKLHNGWNMMSLNVMPENLGMQEVFGNLNVIVKNYKGEIVYFPQMEIKESAWNIYEGYKVKAFQNASLAVYGTQVEPQTIIPLNGGKFPYFLPYYYTRSYPIKQMMFAINNNIRYVQTFDYVNGVLKALNYIPQYGIDQIKFMKPGLAYKLSLLIPMRSFTYPPANIITDSIADNFIGEVKSEPVIQFESNRILVIREEVLPIAAGDIVEAYTTNGDLVGTQISEGGNLALTMWDNPLNADYDSFTLVIFTQIKPKAYNLSFSKNTTRDENLHLLINIISSSREIEKEKFVVKAYPTLVSQNFYIDVYLDKPSNVEVSIFNVIGKKVKQVIINNANFGANQLNINMEGLNAGQYIYQVKTSNKVERGKVQVVK